MLRMFSFGSASFATISVSFGGQFFREGLFKNHGTLPNPMAYTTLGGIPYFQMHPFCVVWDLYHVGQVSFKAAGFTMLVKKNIRGLEPLRLISLIFSW